MCGANRSSRADIASMNAQLGVDATVAAWDNGQPWFEEALIRLQANRDWLARTLPQALPGVRMRTPEATYLAWLDCTKLDLPLPAGQFFLDRARVGLNAGEAFGARYSAFTRLNFATTPAILEQVVGRMSDALRHR